MDLTISISGGRIVTSIYEKPMNLYLYIPPHSAHSSGVSTGLVFGHVLKYRHLCSSTTDADAKIKEFAQRLVARGYAKDDVIALLRKAEVNAANFLARTPAEHALCKERARLESRLQVYFHLQFHPEDPPSKMLQALWKEFVSHPPGEPPLAEMENLEGCRVGFDRLIVAYSLPLNLRNRFSVRDIHNRGKPVSNYLVE